MTSIEATKPPAVLYATLLARCPRCGRGPLFRNFLDVAPSCTSCNMSFSHFEAGDGPAVFVILIVGAIVAGGALLTEVWFQPPYWVHAVIWLPLIVILTFSLLRLMKAFLLVQQYKHQAHEGQRAD